MRTLAINMIVKNEEENLEKDFFKELFNSVNEVVIVDTGSTDRTKDILKKFKNVKLIESDWRDDFSYSRNIAIKNTKSDFILYFDADDEININDIKKIKNYINKEPYNTVFYIKVREISLSRVNGKELFQLRLFPNDGNLFFKGIIHEYIDFDRSKYRVKILNDIEILHKGYYDNEILEKKIKRNLEILERAWEKDKEDFGYNYYLSMTYEDELFKDYDKALFYINNIINSPKLQKHPLYPYAYYQRSKIYNKLDKLEQAIEDINRAIELYNKEVYFYLQRGFYLFRLGEYNRAKQDLERVLKMPIVINFIPVDKYELYAKTIYLLIRIYYKQDDLDNTIKLGEFFIKDFNFYSKKDFFVFLVLAKAYEKKENYQKSKDFYLKSIEILENFEEWKEFNRIYDKDIKRALEIIKNRLEKEPYDFIAINNLGFFYYIENKFLESLNLFISSLELNPLYEDAWINLNFLSENFFKDSIPKEYRGRISKIKSLREKF